MQPLQFSFELCAAAQCAHGAAAGTEQADFLCQRAASSSCWPAVRFANLRVLLLNESAHTLDLKFWHFMGWKRSRLWLRIYYLRRYAMCASESELTTGMERFGQQLRKNHDAEDYSDIMSCVGCG